MMNSRETFKTAIQTAISKLMQEHGYSRERSVSILLHEIFSKQNSLQSDGGDGDEIFNLMRRYGLGSEQATRAMIVSKTLEKLSSEKGISLEESVLEIVSRIQQVSGEHGAVVPDEPLARRAADLRIVPLRRDAETAATRAIHNSSVSHAPTKLARSKSITKKKDSKPCGRKRSIDETSSSTTPSTTTIQEPPRPRADSVTEAVTAKLNPPAEESDSKKRSAPTPARKRARETEGDGKPGGANHSSTSTTKRTRPSTA